MNQKDAPLLGRGAMNQKDAPPAREGAMNQKDAPQAPAFAKGQHGVGSGGTKGAQWRCVYGYCKGIDIEAKRVGFTSSA